MVNTATKQYMKKNEIVADAFNFLVYDGEQVIQPGFLSELDSVEADIPYRDDFSEISVEKVRDILKFLVLKTDGDTVYALLGIENQESIHYAMPVRNMIYDALAYVDQVKRIAEKHKEKKEWKGLRKGEYLSGLHKGDKLFPVVTIVVYFGAEKWDGPIRLHDMLEVTDPKILSMVNDYQIHLITPERLTEQDFNKFRTNLKEVLMFIKYSKDKEKMKKLLQDNKNYLDLDRDAVMVLKECTKINMDFREEEEGMDMCQAWDDWRQEGVEEGIEEGIEKGAKALIETCQEFGLSQEAVAEIIVQKFEVEIKIAERYVTQYWVA